MLNDNQNSGDAGDSLGQEVVAVQLAFSVRKNLHFHIIPPEGPRKEEE